MCRLHGFVRNLGGWGCKGGRLAVSAAPLLLPTVLRVDGAELGRSAAALQQPFGGWPRRDAIPHSVPRETFQCPSWLMA